MCRVTKVSRGAGHGGRRGVFKAHRLFVSLNARLESDKEEKKKRGRRWDAVAQRISSWLAGRGEVRPICDLPPWAIRRTWAWRKKGRRWKPFGSRPFLPMSQWSCAHQFGRACVSRQAGADLSVEEEGAALEDGVAPVHQPLGLR